MLTGKEQENNKWKAKRVKNGVAWGKEAGEGTLNRGMTRTRGIAKAQEGTSRAWGETQA